MTAASNCGACIQHAAHRPPLPGPALSSMRTTGLSTSCSGRRPRHYENSFRLRWRPTRMGCFSSTSPISTSSRRERWATWRPGSVRRSRSETRPVTTASSCISTRRWRSSPAGRFSGGRRKTPRSRSPRRAMWFRGAVVREGVVLIDATVHRSARVDPIPVEPPTPWFNLKHIPSAKQGAPPDVLQLTSLQNDTATKQLFIGPATLIARLHAARSPGGDPHRRNPGGQMGARRLHHGLRRSDPRLSLGAE